MDDISDLAPATTSTPEDAATNIGHANLFSVDPRYAAQNKSTFDEKASVLEKPQQAEPPVAEQMRKSSEHAALLGPDVDHLNFFARQGAMIHDYVFDKPSTQQQIVDLNLKKMNNGGALSNDDDIKLISLNQDAADLDKKDYGISGPIEKIPAIIAGAMSDFGQSMVRGARKGLFESGVPINPFKPRDVVAHLYYGTMVKDPFDTLTAGTYNELGSLTDDNGNPKNLDHQTKLDYARGVGVVGTALMNVGGIAFTESMPFLKPFMNPSLAGGLINTPAKAAIMASIGGMMRGSATMAGVTGMTEFTKIVADEMAQGHGTDEAGFWNALGNAVDKLNDKKYVIDTSDTPGLLKQQGSSYGERVAGAAGQGALFGAAIELPIQIAGFGRTRQRFTGVEAPEAPLTAPPSEPPGGGGPGDGGPSVGPTEPPAAPKSRIQNLREWVENSDPKKMTPNELKFRDDAIVQLKEHDEQVRISQKNQEDFNNRRIAVRQEHLAEKTRGLSELESKYPEGTSPQDYLSEDQAQYKKLTREKGEAQADIARFQKMKFDSPFEIEQPRTPMDMTPAEPKGDPTDEAYKALQFNEALHQMNDVQKATKVNKIAPTELKEMNRTSLTAAGFKEFWSTLGNLRDFATSEEAGARARDLVDPSQVASGQMHAAIALKPHEVMEVAKDYPNILDHISHAPLARNGLQAKEYVEALHRAEEKRAEVMQKLGIKPEEVVPPSGASVTTLPEQGKAPAPNYDFEEATRKTSKMIVERKMLQDRITQLKVEQESNDAIDTERGASSIDVKKEKARIAALIEANQNSIDTRDKQIAEMKAEVTHHLKESPPGKLLIYPFDEVKTSEQAELKFGREPTFTEALRTVLPEPQVAAFDEAVLRARMNTVDLVHDQAVHKMDKLVDQTAALAKEDALRAEIARIENDPNFATVDKFNRYKIANSKSKAKRSMYAIDPTTLPDDLLEYYDDKTYVKERLKAAEAKAKQHGPFIGQFEREVRDRELVKARQAIYNDNPKAKKLAKMGVFAKGGNSAEDSAKALGFNSPRELLEVLANTPTREEVIKARAKAYDNDIEILANSSVDLDHVKIMKAFTDKTMAYLETMKFLKNTDWSKTKFGIRKIALPLPRIEEIENDAREAVSKMKYKDLQPSKYVIGERQSYRAAVDKFLAGDIAGAFKEKENAARNSAMQKEVRKQIGAINRAQTFARKLESPQAKAIFRAAGPFYEKPRDEILDHFNFNPNMKNQSEQDSFAKYVKRMVSQGRGDFTIPDRLSDVRQSIDEMTVEQILVGEDRLRGLFREAQHKNELIKNKDKRDEERNIDRIAEKSIQLAVDHSGGGDHNMPPEHNNPSPGEGIRMFLQSAYSAFTNMEHALRYYDQGKFNGFFQETFFHELKGDGKWNEKSGYSKENKMMHDMAVTMRKIMKNHGDYESVEKKMIYAPEFKDYPSLSKLSKGDMMVMWAYKGDPDGRKYLQSNFLDKNGKGLTLATIEQVLDRELEERDVVAMQYAVDMYEGYKKETRDLQMRDRGEQVVFIKGIPNKHKDKWYPGGYVHINLRHEWSKEAATRQIDLMSEKKAAWFEGQDGAEYGRQFAAEQTEQGRLERRTGTNKPLDLSLLRFWRGHEEVISDLCYREPVKNILKLLRDKRIREAMVRMGGKARYNMIVSTVIEMAGRAEAMNANYFSDQNRFFKDLFGHLQNNFNIGVLGLNLFTSTPIQFEALTQLSQNMGVKGNAHLTWVNTKIHTHPHLFNGLYKFSCEIDPTIGHFMHQLQNKITSTVHDIIPSKSITNHIPFMSPLKAAHKFAVNVGMSPMALVDIYLKVMGALACYAQFMAGHSDNWPIEKVMALSEEDRHNQAIAYARQISRLSLTHGRPEDKAAVQKSPITNFFSNYWNDARNVLNNQMQQGSKIKWAVTAANTSLGEGGGGWGGGSGDGSGGGGGGNGGGGSGETPRQFNGGRMSAKSGLDAAGYLGTAAGLSLAMIVLNTLGRWYSDKLRGIQQTPDQWQVNLKTPAGRSDAAQRMFWYALSSPPDQWASTNPIIRETFFAEQMPDKVIRGYVDKAKTVQVPITKELSDFATATNTLTDAYQASENLSQFLFYLSHLDNKETKAMMNAFSEAFIPLPVNAFSHFMRMIDKPMSAPLAAMDNMFEKLDKTITEFVKKQDLVASGAEPGHFEADPKFVAEVKGIQKQIQPEVAEIPVGAADKIKEAMSGGDWTKPNGVYGFTKDQWDDVKAAAPSLGLTDAGRIAKNTEQQEKAMDFMLHFNKEKLAEADIKVNDESLYGAHRLGVEEYEKLAKAPADAKIKAVLSEETLNNNPDLQTLKTVGQAKDKLLRDLSKGSPKKTAQLTQEPSNPEDKL